MGFLHLDGAQMSGLAFCSFYGNSDGIWIVGPLAQENVVCSNIVNFGESCQCAFLVIRSFEKEKKGVGYQCIVSYILIDSPPGV